MKNWTRPLACSFALALVVLLARAAAGDDPGVRFSVASLIQGLVDPLVLGAALAAALATGGRAALRGLRALLGGAPPIDDGLRDGASRGLAGVARGALYGACVLNGVALASFYWPEAPHESVGWLTPSRLSFVQYGTLLPILLPVLVMLPAAESFGSTRVVGRRVWRALDLCAVASLWSCSMAIVLSVFVWQAPLIGSDTPTATWLPPVFDTFDAGFLAWALVGIAAFVSVATLARARAVLDARTLVAAGVVVSGLVQLSGMNAMASDGGQGDPAELQALAGRMLVPLLLALLALGTTLAVRWRWPRKASRPLHARG